MPQVLELLPKGDTWETSGSMNQFIASLDRPVWVGLSVTGKIIHIDQEFLHLPYQLLLHLKKNSMPLSSILSGYLNQQRTVKSWLADVPENLKGSWGSIRHLEKTRRRHSSEMKTKFAFVDLLFWLFLSSVPGTSLLTLEWVLWW